MKRSSSNDATRNGKSNFPTVENITPFIMSYAHESSEILSNRLEQHGYLFMKQLLPSEEVLSLRNKFAKILQNGGWTDDSSTNAQPLKTSPSKYNPSRIEGYPEFMNNFFNHFQRLKEFHRLSHHPNILSLLEKKIFNKKPFPHPRNIGRVMWPKRMEHTTPPHQDWFYIQGAPRTITAWINLDYCPINHGK